MSSEPDWNLHRTLLAVLQEGSLSGAARRLGLTQPTVARHIDALEQAVGSDLFVRTQLEFADGGSLDLTGKLDLASREKTYDIKADANLFNANAILANAPRTSLNGTVAANGKGFDPATMRAR